MTPRDVLARFAAEGTTVQLKLRLEDTKPSSETLELASKHKDDLLKYLALADGDTPQMCRLSEEKVKGAVNCRRCWRYHTRACCPTDKQYEALE